VPRCWAATNLGAVSSDAAGTVDAGGPIQLTRADADVAVVRQDAQPRAPTRWCASQRGIRSGVRAEHLAIRCRVRAVQDKLALPGECGSSGNSAAKTVGVDDAAGGSGPRLLIRRHSGRRVAVEASRAGPG